MRRRGSEAMALNALFIDIFLTRKISNRAMHLTPVAQFVVPGPWQSIRARCWNFAIGSRTMRRTGTISSDCGGRRGSAVRNVGGRIILEATAFQIENIRIACVFYEDGLQELSLQGRVQEFA